MVEDTPHATVSAAGGLGRLPPGVGAPVPRRGVTVVTPPTRRRVRSPEGPRRPGRLPVTAAPGHGQNVTRPRVSRRLRSVEGVGLRLEASTRDPDPYPVTRRVKRPSSKGLRLREPTSPPLNSTLKGVPRASVPTVRGQRDRRMVGFHRPVDHHGSPASCRVTGTGAQSGSSQGLRRVPKQHAPSLSGPRTEYPRGVTPAFGKRTGVDLCEGRRFTVRSRQETRQGLWVPKDPLRPRSGPSSVRHSRCRRTTRARHTVHEISTESMFGVRGWCSVPGNRGKMSTPLHSEPLQQSYLVRTLNPYLMTVGDRERWSGTGRNGCGVGARRRTTERGVGRGDWDAAHVGLTKCSSSLRAKRHPGGLGSLWILSPRGWGERG